MGTSRRLYSLAFLQFSDRFIRQGVQVDRHLPVGLKERIQVRPLYQQFATTDSDKGQPTRTSYQAVRMLIPPPV
jgi:hypothetical protein